MVDMVDSEWSVIPAGHKRAGNLFMHAHEIWGTCDPRRLSKIMQRLGCHLYFAKSCVFNVYLQTLGHLESMTQLLQEERDFYKRECELLRNMKERSAMMSPPTRERVMPSRK